MDLDTVVYKTAAVLLKNSPAGETLPSLNTISDVLNQTRAVIFPGYFEVVENMENLQKKLVNIHETLKMQIILSLQKQNPDNGSNNEKHANETAISLINGFENIRQQLLKDAQAGFDGDPAAKSTEEIILTYPGFYAIFVYRIAHFLFLRNVPFIPRMMTEHAHSKTGIDIHPGASIGEYFFIDHGTGVVIGETTIIGNHVKLYQGVTLGALSLRKGQMLAGVKRHPTIEDNVTIYSGASILGGETVIGKNSTVGGNVFVTSSIPPESKIK